MAELDVNEGVVPLIEMRFPPPGTLLTPIFPAPTNARTFVILRLLGVLAGVLAKAVDGRMPADQETIRYTGVYGDDLEGQPYLMREVLGGGSGGRYYADGEDTIHVVPDSRNLPDRVQRGPVPVRGRAARTGRRLRWRRSLPRWLRLREAHPDAQGRALHVDRRPVDPGVLGRQGRQGGSPVRGDRRPRRTRRAGGRCAGRRGVRRGRTGDPDPHDRRRRLGRPAGAARTTTWRATWPGARCPSTVPAATTAWCFTHRDLVDGFCSMSRRSDALREEQRSRRAERCGRPWASRSSTAARATPRSPAVRPFADVDLLS